MKTIIDYTFELCERLQTNQINVHLDLSRELVDKAINGARDSMLEIGINCLKACEKCTKSEQELKQELANIGIYWLNEVILNNSTNISIYGLLGMELVRFVAQAYEYLASAYYKIEGFDFLLSRDLLSDVIPENKWKASHYLWAGAKYSEICATEYIMSFLKGDVTKSDIERAHKELVSVLKTTKNTPRIGRPSKLPYFPLYLTSYSQYNKTADLFLKNGADKYAFEIVSFLYDRAEELNSEEYRVERELAKEIHGQVIETWLYYYNLAYCYCFGKGVAVNESKAKELFIKARDLFAVEWPTETFVDDDKIADRLGL